MLGLREQSRKSRHRVAAAFPGCQRLPDRCPDKPYRIFHWLAAVVPHCSVRSTTNMTEVGRYARLATVSISMALRSLSLRDRRPGVSVTYSRRARPAARDVGGRGRQGGREVRRWREGEHVRCGQA